MLGEGGVGGRCEGDVVHDDGWASASSGSASDESVVALGPNAGEDAWQRVELDAAALAKQVRAVRKRAAITQVELARRLGVSQGFVSHAESGKSRVSARFLRRVIEACDVEVTLVQSPTTSRQEALPADWPRDPRYCSGFDPETGEFVRRGSRRDVELMRNYRLWRALSSFESFAHFYDPADLAELGAA